MAIDISDLNHKVSNGGASSKGKLEASEFNRVVSSIIEVQENTRNIVKSISINGGTPATPDDNGLVRLDTTAGGTAYSARLFADIKAEKLVVAKDTLEIGVNFQSIAVSGGEVNNARINGTLRVTSSTDNGESWQELNRFTLRSSTPNLNPTEFTKITIGKFTAGNQVLYLQASYDVVDSDGNIIQKGISSKIIELDITYTNLSLTALQNYYNPLYAANLTAGFPISYMVYGAVQKTLNVEIVGGSGNTLTAQYPLSADVDSSRIEYNIVDASDTYKLFTHGVKRVKAWLTCDDGQGGELSSDVLENQYMMVNPESGDSTTPYLLLQNVIKSTDNYAQAKLLDYAVFSPSIGADGSIENHGDAVNVVFYLTEYTESFPGSAVEYFRIQDNVKPGEGYSLLTTVEIESESDDPILNSYLRVYRVDKNNEEVDFLGKVLTIKVNNSDSFSPKKGADFLLNPKVRNNTEINPNTIINAKGNSIIESTWEGFNFINDGWVTADDNQKVLRVPAGAKLNFKYNPFSQFISVPDSGMTLEIDFAVKNITNEVDPVISLFETATNRGLKILPLIGYLYTKGNIIDDETYFTWQEEKRTHIAINIHPSVTPNLGDALTPPSGDSEYDLNAVKVALVRVFVDDNIQRELKFSITDREEFGTSIMGNNGFTIGQEGCDIDIYSIRCYKNTALEASEIVTNYVSSLPTTEEKRSFKDRNNIMTGGKVDIQKVQALGIRTLIWHGVEPFHRNPAAQIGYWEIKQYDNDGNYMPEYSGTICKKSAERSNSINADEKLKEGESALRVTRQGSTANTYYYSNLQTKIGDVTAYIKVKRSDIHSSITVSERPYLDESMKKDKEGKMVPANEHTYGKQVVDIYGGNLGAQDPVKASPKMYIIEGDEIEVPDGWIDGNGKYRGQGYQLKSDTPLASKLVNKINYASSMQGHLTGVNNLYNDLHTAIVGKNSLQQDCPTARVSKYTEPFMFFTQGLTDNTPVYRGPCTFGAGKMDKPTWGYVKKLHPMFTMIEGADNNFHLTDMRVPFTWKQRGCSENITYNLTNEGFVYDKQGLDFDAGATDSEKVPENALVDRISEVWNWLYLHSPMLQYFRGSFDTFQLESTRKDVTKKYWCTEGPEAYKLKRYNYIDGTWVDAGLWKNGKWEVIDLKTYSITADVYNTSTNISNFKELNNEFIGAIVADAKKYIGFYFREASLKLYYTFVIHLMAGTDSCSKNTYYVLDPKPVKVTIGEETRSCYLFELHTDDVDTVLPIDNNGRATKKYYIDRMHPYNDEDLTTNKYEGANNVLFNLCELMWEDTKELQSMMRLIFACMAGNKVATKEREIIFSGLVSDTDNIIGLPSSVEKRSVLGCLWKYIYSVMKYFPAMAYNEAARIRYEYPAMIGFVSKGSGGRSVPPITQSNGNLLQAELQFINRRLIYMCSYAAWGPFWDGKDGNLGIAGASNFMNLQVFHLPGMETSNNNYTLKVKPSQYLYPIGMLGQDPVDWHHRVAPNEEFELDLGNTTSNDTGIAINGIDYFYSIGNVGDLSVNPNLTVTIQGKRLTEFIANPTKYYTDIDDVDYPAFRPQSIVVNASNIKTLNMQGSTGARGNLDLSKLTRLQHLNIKDTGFTGTTLPNSNSLSSIHYPASITKLELNNFSKLSEFTIQGYKNLTSVSVLNTPFIKSYSLIALLYAANPIGLTSITIDNISWTNVNLALLLWIASKGGKLYGKIELQSGNQVLLKDKIILAKAFGDIDSASSDLQIIYPIRAITSINLHASRYTTKTVPTDEPYSIIPNPVSGNNIAIIGNRLNVDWKMSDEAYDYATLSNDGLLHVHTLTDKSLNLTHTITGTAHLLDGSTLSASRNMQFYNRVPEVGDFAYGNGTFSNQYDEDADLMGLVFMRIPNLDKDGQVVKYDLRIISETEQIPLVSSDKAAAYTGQGLYWGITQVSSGSAGYTSAELQDIAEATGISNVLNTGGVSGGEYSSVRSPNYLDDSTDDGFKVATLASATFEGYKLTKNIVSHANKIVTLYLNETFPTTLNELADVIQKYSNTDRKLQCYYPAATACNLFEPNHKEKLHDSYKKGEWFLGSQGECTRLAYYAVLGINTTDANEDSAQKEADRHIFANANLRAGKQLFASLAWGYGTTTWVSTWHANQSYFVYRFMNGNSHNWNPMHNAKYSYLPMAQFTFEL